MAQVQNAMQINGVHGIPFLYSTTHGKSIKDLIKTIIEWGLKHREIVLKQE